MDRAAQHCPRARHHPVGRGDRGVHAEMSGAVLGEHSRLGERAVINELIDALACGELALLMLTGDSLIHLRFAQKRKNARSVVRRFPLVRGPSFH